MSAAWTHTMQPPGSQQAGLKWILSSLALAARGAPDDSVVSVMLGMADSATIAYGSILQYTMDG